MKLFRNLSLGIALGALTAAGALMGATQPAAAQAPPGFLQLPGTGTSLLITGQVGTRVIYDSAQTGFPGFYEQEADALIPVFIGTGRTAPLNNGASANSVHFSSTDANIGFITATQTGWGELQTVLILASSYNGFTAYAPPSAENGVTNTGITPLLAFGTLGPIMVGVNTSLFGDDDANPTSDMMNEPFGVAGVVGEIIPGLRYTWKGPGGLSIAVAAEQSTNVAVSHYPNAACGAPPAPCTDGFGNFDNVEFAGYQSSTAGQYGPDPVLSGGSLDGNTYVPNFVARVRLDQPWGHIALSGIITEDNTSCNINCSYLQDALIPSSAGTLPDFKKTGWGLNLTGHLNTFGKDKLMGGIFGGQGLGSYMGDYGDAGMSIGQLTPATLNGAGTAFATQATYEAKMPMEFGFYAAYKHFWTDQLRSTIAGGYSHVQNLAQVTCGNVAVATCDGETMVAPGVLVPNDANAALINGSIAANEHWSLSGNLIWSPVNNVDLGAQVIYYHVEAPESDFINGFHPGGHDLRIEGGGTIRF